MTKLTARAASNLNSIKMAGMFIQADGPKLPEVKTWVEVPVESLEQGQQVVDHLFNAGFPENEIISEFRWMQADGTPFYTHVVKVQRSNAKEVQVALDEF
jgi:hypothetical protein